MFTIVEFTREPKFGYRYQFSGEPRGSIGLGTCGLMTSAYSLPSANLLKERILGAGGGLITHRERAGENRAKILAQRSPDLKAMILMSDALACNFVGLEDDEVMANCMAHGRRNFVKIIDAFPEDCQKVIAAIVEVYYNEGFTKDYTDDQRLAYHQQHSGPVMAELKAWLYEQVSGKKVEPNSKLGKAIAYMRNHWKALTLFLHVPGAPLDNNICYAARGITNVMPTPGLCRVSRPNPVAMGAKSDTGSLEAA